MINRNINLHLCHDEKERGKEIRLNAKHEPLNTDANVNWHLYLIFFLFFLGMVRGEKEDTREISRGNNARIPGIGGGCRFAADSFQLCCILLPLCSLK